LAISASGLVVGRADFSPSSPNHHAVLWKEATITDLGVVSPCKNSTATSVNSSGKVVGNLGGCTNDSSDVAYSSAFVWKRGGEMVDLNTLVRNPTDLHLDGASFINNRGEIAGGAVTPTGEGRSVLLIPVSDY
jgi:probable HAF family extracellular repeat protein